MQTKTRERLRRPLSEGSHFFMMKKSKLNIELLEWSHRLPQEFHQCFLNKVQETFRNNTYRKPSKFLLSAWAKKTKTKHYSRVLIFGVADSVYQGHCARIKSCVFWTRVLPFLHIWLLILKGIHCSFSTNSTSSVTCVSRCSTGGGCITCCSCCRLFISPEATCPCPSPRPSTTGKQAFLARFV